MSDDGLLVARDGAVLRLTLNRPDKLNAITMALALALREALESAASDAGIRAVLITGSGRAFCAGQDLADPQVQAGQDLGEIVAASYNPVIRALRTMEKPVLAAVNGVAAGAGANLAFACDIVIAARSATFIESFARIGLVPDSGGTWMLPRLFGHARAAALAMLGEKITAQQAFDWGAIWAVVDDSDLAAAAETLSRTLADAPTRGIGATKTALEAAWENDLDAQLELESDLQSRLGASADYREGVSAFREKRKPHFTGS